MELMNNILNGENPVLNGPNRNYVYTICWHDKLGRANYKEYTREKPAIKFLSEKTRMQFEQFPHRYKIGDVSAWITDLDE